MKNRIFDCVDGRSRGIPLSERERRLSTKIRAGLRNRADDYRITAGPYRVARSTRASSRRAGRISPEKSALAAFLERSVRRRLKAG